MWQSENANVQVYVYHTKSYTINKIYLPRSLVLGVDARVALDVAGFVGFSSVLDRRRGLEATAAGKKRRNKGGDRALLKTHRDRYHGDSKGNQPQPQQQHDHSGNKNNNNQQETKTNNHKRSQQQKQSSRSSRSSSNERPQPPPPPYWQQQQQQQRRPHSSNNNYHHNHNIHANK